MIRVSIIMPIKDRPENTKQLLDQLTNQVTDQVEVIVVENNSAEDMTFLDSYDFRIAHETVPGVSHARNVALDMAEGEYICFIDNDDHISDDYVPTILEYIEEKPGYDWYAWAWASDHRPIMYIDMERPLKSCWALWRYCFHRDLFNGVRFDENKKAGGDLIIFSIITPQTKGYFISKVLYDFTWNGNEDSLSHRYNRGEL